MYILKYAYRGGAGGVDMSVKKAVGANDALTSDKQSPFHEFMPVRWQPYEDEEPIYSVKRNHGIRGAFKLHNVNDAINDNRPSLDDKILLEYCINDCSYPVVTAADMLNSPYPWDAEAQGNILGEVAERIARRITKYFLKHWSRAGRTGGYSTGASTPGAATNTSWRTPASTCSR